MANWTKGEPQGNTQRKKWNLQDRTSLKNLKFHIAEDGSSDIQYDLARQLLEENSETDANTNYAQGIYWLLRSANQGHVDALILLAECYRTRRGITDYNECDVQTCLSMSSAERNARKAARELFACLSNGEEYITASHLERKMREIFKMQKKKRKRINNEQNSEDGGGEDEDGSGSSSSTSNNNRTINNNGNISPVHHFHHRNDLYNSDLSNDYITEANLVSAATNYSNGNLPPVSEALTLSVPHPQTLDHVPCFHRLIFHPILFFTLFYHRFIRILSSFPTSIISNFQMILIVLIYMAMASENTIMFIPLTIYYLSFVIMIVATFKMIKTKHDFVDFRMWSGLFLRYGDHSTDAAEDAENQFLRNNMKPYLYFFIAFSINIILKPLIPDQLIPHSEITIVSFVLIFVTMFAFMYTSDGAFPDVYILLSFGVNVLAKYPYESDSVVITGWRFLDLKVPNFPSFVIGNGIEFCLNCRALLYLLIPGFLCILACRKNWHGTYQYLIPHCCTLSWLQLCIISSECATMFGLVRATLGLAGLLLFLPLFGIVTLLIPVFAVIEWLSLTDPTIRLTASISAVLFTVIGSCVLATNHRTAKYITVLQIIVCIIATAFLTLPYMTSNFATSHSQSNLFDILKQYKTVAADNRNDKIHSDDIHRINDNIQNSLNWKIYYNYCSYPGLEYNSKINTQIRCSQLDGTPVKWNGIVTNIEISHVKNIRSELIYNYLPNFLSEFITCFYGEKNQVNCSSGDGENCDDMKYFIDEQKRCNLNHWNTYEYQITVRMKTEGIFNKPIEIQLMAKHNFGNFTQYINESDLIWFKGILKNTISDNNSNGNGGKFGGGGGYSKNRYMLLGNNRPVILLQSIGCLDCRIKNIEPFEIVDGLKVHDRVKDLYRGIKYLLNVLFNPLVIIK